MNLMKREISTTIKCEEAVIPSSNVSAFDGIKRCKYSLEEAVLSESARNRGNRVLNALAWSTRDGCHPGEVMERQTTTYSVLRLADQFDAMESSRRRR